MDKVRLSDQTAIEIIKEICKKGKSAEAKVDREGRWVIYEVNKKKKVS